MLTAISQLGRGPRMSKIPGIIGLLATTRVSWMSWECERSMPTVAGDVFQGDGLKASIEIEGKGGLDCWWWEKDDNR